MSKVVI